MKRIFTMAAAIGMSVSLYAQTTSQTFTNNGTFTVPAGVTQITVECWGGGGSGAGRTTNGYSGGGGGGAYSMGTLVVSPGNIFTVTVGGFKFGTTGDGSTGNPSWFGSTTTVYAAGGSGGTSTSGGAGGAASLGYPTSGGVRYSGGDGVYNNAALRGGGGGAGSTGNGGNASTSQNTGGTGTANNGGAGGIGVPNAPANSVNQAGSNYGGGGGGSRRTNGNIAYGGNGAQGLVVVTYCLPQPVSVSIAASANPSCNGTSVTFTATPTNGGTAPSYQWKVNGVNVGTNSPTYSYIPTNSDQVICILTSNASCPTGNPATSNTIIMTVNLTNPVSIAISASANPVCAGTSVSFTAIPINGGSTPSYQWKRNGTNVGTNNPTYTYVPTNSDVITCVLTSNISCPTSNPATSNAITMTVNTLPPVSIPGSNSICINSTTNLSPTTGGTWVSNNPAVATVDNTGLVKGLSPGTATFTFTDASTGCNNTTLAVTVNPTLSASVSISASSNPSCSGNSVTFTAAPTNGGSSPYYQWICNGVDVGTNSPTYTYTPLNNDNISCLMTSNATCAAIAPAVSNPIPMSVVGAFSGTYTVGNPGNFNSLTTAFAALSSCGLSGPVFLALQSTYNFSMEGSNVTLTIPQINTVNSTNTITIYPAVSGLTLTSSNVNGTLNFNGADYITIDGRVNQTGNANLAIENTNSGGYAIQFTNDASHNTIEYCEVKGVNTSATEGVITFDATLSGSSGNDNNTIDHCNIHDGASTPTNLIYSVGTSARQNDNNTVSNCNIYNWFNSGNDHAGIFLSSGNTDWTVNGNSFYQTGSRFITSVVRTFAILVANSATGNNFLIENNYIGGQSAQCGGNAMTYTGRGYMEMISLDAGIGTKSIIQNNVIKNINFTTSVNGGSLATGNIAQGYIFVMDGSCDILNNQIGDPATSGQLSASLKFTANGNYWSICGIAVGFGSAAQQVFNIKNNLIGGIYLGGTTYNSEFEGILLQTTGTISNSTSYTVDGNIIGSSTTGDCITVNTLGDLWGIVAMAGGDASTNVLCTISNNTIANSTISNVNSGADLIAIQSQGNNYYGIYSILNNSIFNLKSTGSLIRGINHIANSNPGQDINGNTIYSLINTYTLNVASVTQGIFYSGPTSGTNIIEKNFLHSMTMNNTSTNSVFEGIRITAGSTYLQNNMIQLGIDNTGADITRGYSFTGIYENGGTNNILFNSVYIGGTVSNVTSSTYAFYSAINTNVTRKYENNIFYNARKSGTTGYHYGIQISNNGANLTSDYNNIIVSDSTGRGYVGYYTANRRALPDWRSATGKDANSQRPDPIFLTPTGNSSTSNLHITDQNSPCNASGISISGITDDIDGDPRPETSPDIGADQFSTWFTWNGNTDKDWGKAINWTPTTMGPPLMTQNAIIPGGRPNYPVIDQYNLYHCRNLSINSGGSVTINPGNSLEVRGTLTLNGNNCMIVKSDATGTGALKYTSLTGTGTATVQQYLAQGQWHYITSPVTDGKTGVFFHDWLRYYQESVGNWSPYIIPTTWNLPVMTGYEVWSPTSNTALKMFSGHLNSANDNSGHDTIPVTHSSSGGGGWNLVGNPYPCPIDLNSSSIKWGLGGSIDPIVYYYDAKKGNTFAWVYNVTPTPFPTPPSGWGYGTGSRYVPAMQAFFIHTNANDIFQVSTGAMALDPGQAPFYKSSDINNNINQLFNNNIIPICFDARSLQNNYFDKTMICFNQNSHEGFESNKDAYKWTGGSTAPQLYTKADSINVCVNTLPWRGVNMTIPLYFSCGLNGDYALTFDSATQVPQGKNIWIEDKKLHKVVEFSPQKPYKFIYTTDDSPARFILHFKNVHPGDGPEDQILSNPDESIVKAVIQVYSFEKTVYVRNDNANLTGEVVVYNLLGTVVFRGKLEASTINVYQTDLSPGVYVVSVITQDGNVNQKVVLR